MPASRIRSLENNNIVIHHRHRPQVGLYIWGTGNGAREVAGEAEASNETGNGGHDTASSCSQRQGPILRAASSPH